MLTTLKSSFIEASIPASDHIDFSFMHTTWQVRWATSDATFGVADGAEVVEERSSGVPTRKTKQGSSGGGRCSIKDGRGGWVALEGVEMIVLDP
ncbi:hypothetical protein BHE74_00046920 [Ensete ventricosum]|nr:hypothetical protein BHE74_00046920 [Ensete ventricosum]